MNQTDIKRQLLADVLNGESKSLRAYKANRRKEDITPYQWIIKDEIGGTFYSIDKNGSHSLITTNDLIEFPQRAIWRIVDFSGGVRIPDVDE